MAFLLTNLKNRYTALRGFHTKRHFVIIESDDWGSIRMPSHEVFEKLQALGDHPEKDAFLSNDCLENCSDLERLYNVLESVTDQSGHPAVITANFAVANPDFDRIDIKTGSYEFELFTETYKRYYPNENVISCVQNGMQRGLFFPQLHCREHMNISRWMMDLKRGKRDTLIAFENHLIGINASFSENNPFGYMDAFNSNYSTDEELRSILYDAMRIFEETFGRKSSTFVASCYVWDDFLEKTLADLDVQGIQSACWQYVPLGRTPLRATQNSIIEKNNRLTRRIHFTGQKNTIGQLYSIRNCAYEPAYYQNAAECAALCFRQIHNALHDHKPAIISSHRFNYISSINPTNAENNLEGLMWLLKKIVKEYPDIEFITTEQLFNVMEAGADRKLS